MAALQFAMRPLVALNSAVSMFLWSKKHKRKAENRRQSLRRTWRQKYRDVACGHWLVRWQRTMVTACFAAYINGAVSRISLVTLLFEQTLRFLSRLHSIIVYFQWLSNGFQEFFCKRWRRYYFLLNSRERSSWIKLNWYSSPFCSQSG